MQTRKASLIESLANVAVGYIAALLSQIVIFHFYGVQFPLRTNLAIGCWFTVVSIIRSYTLRRIFNSFRNP